MNSRATITQTISRNHGVGCHTPAQQEAHSTHQDATNSAFIKILFIKKKTSPTKFDSSPWYGNLKPLSHQSGVLTACTQRLQKLQNAEVRAVQTSWTL